MIQYEDGTKAYEWEIDENEYNYYHSGKSSKFDYNFLESEVGPPPPRQLDDRDVSPAPNVVKTAPQNRTQVLIRSQE